jgi:hypothetical protein
MVKAYMAAAMIIAAALGGCSGGGESSASAAPYGPVSVASSTAPTPPAYAPLYPGAVLESSAESGGTSASATITFHTTAKPSDVIAFYRHAAQVSRLDSTFSSQSGDDELFSAGRQGSEDGMQVIVTPAEGGASVQLFWTGSRQR